MKHYGDITKINGADVEPVWIVTGGSPCQDLSVAGKRAGLDGERSGLFMEQIRIIKEMRENDRRKGRTDELVRPRYMVWENVKGAFSSNKGQDFRVVLEETAKIADENAVIPRLEGKQKWTPSGCILGDGWSIAWRVHDAQFWGVPQRRKRIALVADFGGMSAPEILFEREGLSGNTEQSGEKGEDLAADTEGSVRTAGKCLKEQPILLESNQNHATVQTNGVSTALSASMGMGGGYVPMITDVNDRENIFVVDQGGGKSQCAISKDVTPTLATTVSYGFDQGTSRDVGKLFCKETAKAVTNGTCPGHHNGVVTFSQDAYDKFTENEKAASLKVSDRTPTLILENHPNDSRVKISKDKVFQALTSRAGTGGGNTPMVMENVIVRRLTPLECERLQGFPDGWTLIGNPEEVIKTDYEIEYGIRIEKNEDGDEVLAEYEKSRKKIGTHKEIEYFYKDENGKKKKCSDTHRYKALGNSIALPFWQWMAERMVKYIDDEPTMASLFDGIGGFPLVYSRVGCKPIWASEIEEFPIAVTKLRFGDK